MIKNESLTADWISERRMKYSKDPAIMEAMIYALYLLEQLQKTDLEFIFKGGTSLVLFMDRPKRFSVDVDIVFDKNRYTKTIKNPVETEWLMQEGESIEVILPNIDSITGDEKDPALKEINTGINQFKHYLFEGTFGLMEAKVASSKAALLAAIILKDSKGELTKFDPDLPLKEYLINDPDYNYLNKRLKFVEKGEALFYWYHALKILNSGK